MTSLPQVHTRSAAAFCQLAQVHPSIDRRIIGLSPGNTSVIAKLLQWPVEVISGRMRKNQRLIRWEEVIPKPSSDAQTDLHLRHLA